MRARWTAGWSVIVGLVLSGCSSSPTTEFPSGASATGASATDGSGETTQGSGPSDDPGSEGNRLDLFSDVVDIQAEECADVKAEIVPGEAILTLLLDQSGTMVATLGQTGIRRWDAVFETLLDPTTGVVASFESEVQFGMSLYTNGDQPAGCPDLVTVAPAFDNRAAMAERYGAASPIGDTPTGESLLAVGEALATIGGSASKGVVLATDGDPDMCSCPNSCGGLSKGAAIQAAQTLYDMGIRVFVIAVGDSITDLAHLQHLANVGLGRARYYDDPALIEWDDPWVDDVAPADPAPLFTANNQAELTAAFGTLISGFVPCDFAINGTIEDLDRACARGTVVLDGVTLECPVDWTVVDPTTLTLTGEACDALQDGETHDVAASFPCDVISIG